jgi:hypothetical protein
MKRLGLANYGPMTWDRFGKGSEAPIYIDVIDDDSAAPP